VSDYELGQNHEMQSQGCRKHLSTDQSTNQSINHSITIFFVRLKVDQRAGQPSLPHLGITKTEKIELKHKTDEQISPVNGLEP